MSLSLGGRNSVSQDLADQLRTPGEDSPVSRQSNRGQTQAQERPGSPRLLAKELTKIAERTSRTSVIVAPLLSRLTRARSSARARGSSSGSKGPGVRGPAPTGNPTASAGRDEDHAGQRCQQLPRMLEAWKIPDAVARA